MGQNTRWLTTSQMCFFLLLSRLFTSQLRLALCLLQTSCILACLEAILSLKFCTLLVLTLGPSGQKAGAGGGKETRLSKRLACRSKLRRRKRAATKKMIPSNSRLGHQHQHQYQHLPKQVPQLTLGMSARVPEITSHGNHGRSQTGIW